MQKLLIDAGISKRREPSKEQLNYIFGDIQRIKTSEGCPNGCPFCYEPTKTTYWGLPEITKSRVEILDMNFIARSDIRAFLSSFPTKYKGLRIKYESVCGFDYRFMNPFIAELLKEKGFIKPRIAWDGRFTEQLKIKYAVKCLLDVGYKPRQIMCFMIVNWIIPMRECFRKLDLLKVWGIKVCDCCFDGGYKTPAPNYWSELERVYFRNACRKHNQLVPWGFDPEPNNPEGKREGLKPSGERA